MKGYPVVIAPKGMRSHDRHREIRDDGRTVYAITTRREISNRK